MSKLKDCWLSSKAELSCASLQVLGLQGIGVPALALTSLTSKEDQSAAYKRMDTDLDIRLVYGEQLSLHIGLMCRHAQS